MAALHRDNWHDYVIPGGHGGVAAIQQAQFHEDEQAAAETAPNGCRAAGSLFACSRRFPWWTFAVQVARSTLDMEGELY